MPTSNTKDQRRDLGRRGFLRGVGAGLAIVPFGHLLGCVSEDIDLAATEGLVGVDPGTDQSSAVCGPPADSWTTGGTAAMTAKDCYPDPFADGITTCSLYCRSTPGPCTSTAPTRRDISEGMDGLPVRLALLVVDPNCEPVANAWVEIWHTQRAGIYSGRTPGGRQCYRYDPSAVDRLYFRGKQRTGATGRVAFDTCFPGWYPGRANHIHFRVRLGSTAYVTSQLFFDDALNAEIFDTHPDYAEFGAPDTTNEDDGILGGNRPRYLLNTERMPDGAMLASKVVTIRSSTSQGLCSV